MYLVSTAMVCPIGLSVSAACAAKRAGISGLNDLPYEDRGGERIVGGMVPGQEAGPPGPERLAGLLSMALSQLVEARPGERWHEVPLLVGLGEPGRPGSGTEAPGRIVGRVQDALGVRFHPTSSKVFATGHTAGFEGLRTAGEHFAGGKIEACLVCGVDSFVNAGALRWLERDYRLKTTMNRDGLIPGEAAAAVLVRPKPVPGAQTQILGLGFGTEQAHLLSEEPLRALGLADAVNSALAQARLGYHEIDLRVSDVTGELYGFKEVALMEARVMRTLRKTPQPIWHWVEAIGDCGAAAGVVQLIAVDDAFRNGYAPGQSAICLTSANPGNRAAVVLQSTVR